MHEPLAQLLEWTYSAAEREVIYRLIRGCGQVRHFAADPIPMEDRKSTRLNSSHLGISYAVFCLKKKIALQRTDLELRHRCQAGAIPHARGIGTRARLLSAHGATSERGRDKAGAPRPPRRPAIRD